MPDTSIQGTLEDIAQDLKNSSKKTQLVYAFNGTGKTRVSREFKGLVDPASDSDEEKKRKIIYYSAFTEDLFYWDNDLENNEEPKLKIQPNVFIRWILEEQGHSENIAKNFKRYSNTSVEPNFNEDYTEVTFSLDRGDQDNISNIKISKGEESNFIWSVFYSVFEEVMEILSEVDPSNRSTDQFDDLEYIFIDDPVSSLDDNHLIELAVNIAELIKKYEHSQVKFIITTHNPLFYNVLFNELLKKKYRKLILEKNSDGTYKMSHQDNDSPFAYHLSLMSEIEKAIEEGRERKYHFNFLRNILEKTCTFLGYEKWGDLLPKEDEDSNNLYEKRVLNISSHSKHSGTETGVLTDDEKRILRYLLTTFKDTYKFR